MLNTHKKRCLIILSVIFASLMIIAGAIMFAPENTAHADEEETHDHSIMTAINSNGELTTGAYYLTDNISGNISVTGEVNLCLNGHTVTGDGNGSVITVSDGAEFTLCDCTGDGVITGGRNVGNGGGVYIGENSTFTMTGGTISENTAETYRIVDRYEGGMGGGVYVSENSTLTMTGGTISGNSASYGGVYVSENSTFTMTGGTISGNKANGGGVYVNGTFEMTDGTISGNTAITGGGVYVNENSTFTMTGGTISENVAFDEDFFSRGGGVYVDINAVFEMCGGTISGNTADIGGGGLYSWRGNLSVSGTPNITGNKLTDDTVSNVDYYDGSSIIITVTGELTAGAQIGIFKTGAVATGFTQEGNPANYFIPDNSANNCVYANDGTVTVGEHSNGYDSDADGHWLSCVNCGKAFGEKEAHDGNPCTVCGYTAHNHSFSELWSYDEISHWHVCNDCGETTDEDVHSFATGGKCSVCQSDANLYWKISGGKLILSSCKRDEAFVDYTDSTWVNSKDSIISVEIDTYAYAPESMANWFGGCANLTSADLKGLDTSRVTDMSRLFNGCNALASLDVSHLNTSNVIDMSYIFNGCGGLEKQTLILTTDFSTASVTDMNHMFSGCSGLTQLYFSYFPAFTTSEVTDMSYMFSGCSGLSTLIVSTFNTSKVGNMKSMFSACAGLFSLNLSSFDLSSITSAADVENIFDGCEGLNAISTPKNVGELALSLPATFWNGERGTDIEAITSADESTAEKIIIIYSHDYHTLIADIGQDKTCTEDGVLAHGHCSVCGKNFIDGAEQSDEDLKIPAGHEWATEWTYDESSHWYACNYCDERNSEAAHSGEDDNDCTTAVICSCGYEITAAQPEHNYVNGECTHCDATAYFEVTATLTENYVTIEEAFAAAKTAGTATIKMYADAEISATFTVAEGEDITLDLNGNMLKQTEMFRVISVNGTFTLEDSGDGTSSHSITNPAKNNTVVIGGGVICGGNSQYGGGVYVSGANSKFTLTGGTICGNTAQNSGGGVYVTSSGTFEMSGTASVSYNIAKTDSWGGGVRVNSGTFKMSGGVISGNGAVRGGGVCIYSGEFEMSGGTIDANFAVYGGGVYVGDTFKVSGAVNITGNDHLINETANNVYFVGNNNITVTDALDEGAQIGVYNTGAVATGFTQEGDPKNYFIPDVSTNNCIYADDGTVSIGTHSFEFESDDNIKHWQVCANCGYNKNDEAAHSFADGECTVCGYNASQLYWAIKTEGEDKQLVLSYYQIDDDFKKYVYMNANWDRISSLITSVNVETYAYAPQNIGYWFEECVNLEDVDLTGLDTSRVTYMGGMFYECRSLTSLDLSDLDTSKAENLGDMFYGCSSLTTLDISSFDLAGAVNMGGMFRECASLTSLTLPSFDNATNINNMDYLFAGCESLTSLDELTKLKTAGVKNFSFMFFGCSSLEMLNLSSFNTSGVTNESKAEDMFAGCTSLTEIITPATVGSVSLPLPDKFVYETEEGAYVCITEIAGKDAGKTITRHLQCVPSDAVTENGVEATCTSAGGYDTVIYCSVCGDEVSRTPHEIPALGHDYVSGVCTRCDDNATALYWGLNDGVLTLSSHNSTLTPNRYSAILVSGQLHPAWHSDKADITSVTVDGYAYAPVYMAYWFSECVNLATVDLTGLDTSRTTNMYRLFYECNNDGFTALDVGGFNTAKVTDMSYMFYDCRNVSSLDVTNFDTSKVTTMHCMFWGCKQLTSLDLTDFDTANVTTMNYMFAFCDKLSELDVSNFNTAKVTDMGGMFRGCGSLTELDVSNFNTAKVTRMSEMFEGCDKLDELDVTGFNTANVEFMNDMFSGCKFDELDVTNFNTAKVTNMREMFSYCSNLTTLDLSSFDTSKVTNMGYMFYSCSGLTSLDLSYFDMSAVTTTFAMLAGCNFNTLKTPKGVGTTAVALPCKFWDGTADIEEITSEDINKTIYRHKNHSYGEWQSVVAPTCTVEGAKAHKDCTVCLKHFDNFGMEITDLTIAPLDHDFTGAYHSDGGGHWHVCLRDNCGVTDTKESHSSTNVDCTLNTTCTACGYLIKSAEASHSFSDEWTAGADTHWRACTNEGCESIQDEADHIYESGECTVCHDTAYFCVTENGVTTYYKTITEAFEAVENTATVTMFDNAEISETLVINEGKDITLDLNGNILEMTDSGSVISVNGSFTLKDDSESGDGVICGGNSEYGGGVYVAENGSFTMSGGTVSGNEAYSDGGGVYVDGGSFEMSGGTISENTVSLGGGGVCVENGSFTMSGGTITGNMTNDSGGGVYIGGGSFEMSGGAITENQSGAGGGVCVNRGSFTMSGTAEISNNNADGMFGFGGGVYCIGVLDDNGELSTDCAFTMTGGSINGNISSLGGGVCVMGLFIMTGGEINGNTATYGAGGVLLILGVFDISDGTISGNMQTEDVGLGFCGGVCVGHELMIVEDVETTLKISGTPTITGNTAVIDGETLENNVALFSGYIITVTGALTDPDDPDKKAQIGINNTGAVATGFMQSNPADFFIPDDPANNCIYISDGESGAVTVGTHTGGTATCSAKAQCPHCGEEYGDIDPDNHDWNDGEVTTEPTCTQTGEKTFVCAYNSEHTKTESVDALGHDYGEWIVEKEATCTENGSRCRVCSRDGQHKETDEISPIAHSEVVDTAVEPTCTEEGKTEGKHCSVCGTVLVAQTSVPAKGHTEAIDTAVEPTCTAEGKTEGKHCSVCDTVLVAQTSVPAKEHKLIRHDGKAATCTEKGWSAYETCSECGYTTYSEIDALGHDFATEFTVDKEATCLADGSKSRHCTRCGEKTEITKIPAVPHSLQRHPENPATTDSDGNIEYWSCDDCNKYFSDAAGETEITDKSSVGLPKITEDTNGGLSAGAIAGITIGIILFVLLVIYVVCYFALYRRKVLLKGKFFDVIYKPMNLIFNREKADKENSGAE